MGAWKIPNLAVGEPVMLQNSYIQERPMASLRIEQVIMANLLYITSIWLHNSLLFVLALINILTTKIADVFWPEAVQRRLIRMLLTTKGRLRWSITVLLLMFVRTTLFKMVMISSEHCTYGIFLLLH